MSKGAIFYSVLLLIIAFGFPAVAGGVVWEFQPDSLVNTSSGFQYQYPGLDNINVNEKLSLPVVTVYLETSSEIAASDFIVKSNDQLTIGAISPENIQYDNSTTSADPHFLPPARGSFKTGSVVYDLQRIKTKTFDGYAVTLLPVSIDEDYNIVFNKTISLPDASLVRELKDAHQLIVTPSTISSISSSRPADVKKSGSYNGVPLGSQYIIITSPDLAETFEELSDFRNATGISAAIALTDSIYVYYSGVDNPEKIRNYLTDFYNNGGVYVLLGGDDITVPVRYAYFFNTSSPPSDPYDFMPTDLYYGDLDGDWEVDGDGIWGEPNDDAPNTIPELIVGRLPLRTISSARQYISKLKNYLTNPGNGDFDFLTRSFFFSSDQMRDYPSEGQHGVIASELPANFAIDTTDGIEAPTGDDPAPTNVNGQTCIDIVSEGYGFIHILAHGRTDGFLVKSANYGDWPASLIIVAPDAYNHGTIANLAKNNKTSLYYSLACNSGAYDLDSTEGVSADWSFVEGLIRCDSSGAVGMVANARWGWVYTSYHLQQAFTKNLFEGAEGNPAVAMYLSWIDYPYYRDLIYGQNYFGDPALKIYASTPERFDMEIIPQRGNYRIGLYNNGDVISDAIITVALDGEVIETGISDADGQYLVEHELNYGTEYVLTAMKEGCTINQQVFTPSMGLSVDDEDNILPERFYLEQNYPNPFNPTTVIKYNLPVRSDICLDIFNILGQSIKTVSIDNQSSGVHSIIWNGTDDNNNLMPSGTYLYRLQAGEKVQSRKMLLMK